MWNQKYQSFCFFFFKFEQQEIQKSVRRLRGNFGLSKSTKCFESQNEELKINDKCFKKIILQVIIENMYKNRLVSIFKLVIIYAQNNSFAVRNIREKTLQFIKFFNHFSIDKIAQLIKWYNYRLESKIFRSKKSKEL